MRLGIDAGTVRIGVARSDPDGILASPLQVIRRGPGDFQAIAALARQNEAIEIIVGIPTSLSGREGKAAQACREFAERLADFTHNVPIRLFDERFTTVSAHTGLRAAGKDGRARREVVDKAAAAILLQAALDAERATGRAPGHNLRERA